MNPALHRLFRVLPDETAKLALFALLLALLQAGVAVGMTAADSLFLTYLGAGKLPIVYLGMPVMMVLYAPVYSWLLARVGIERLVRITLVALVVGGIALGAAAASVGENRPGLLYAMKFYAGLWFIALYTLFWNFADDYFSILEGKRLYGIIAAGGAAGGALGAVAVSSLARFVPPGRMFFLWAALAAGTLFVFTMLVRRSVKIESDTPPPGAPSALRTLTPVFATLRHSRFAVSLALICFCSVLLATSLEYLTLGVLSQGKSAVELAQSLGKLYAVASALTLAISLVVFNRIVAAIGVGNTALILPLVFLTAFAGFFLEYGLGAALVGLYVYQTLLAAIEYNNVNLLFNALPAVAKRPLRTFVEAMSEPLATALAGGLLLAWAARIGPGNLAFAGMVAAVAALLVAFVLRQDYARALADNLRADWLDFSPPPEHWRNCLSAADRRLLRETALQSRVRAERVAATDLLAYTGDPAAAEALIELLRFASARDAEQLRPAINRVLRQGDAQAVAGLLSWLEGAEGPEDPAVLEEFSTAGALPLRHLRQWSDSPEPSRVALAAVGRWRGSGLDEEERALADVRRLLGGAALGRRWGIRAVGEFQHTPHVETLLALLHGADLALRADTLRALHKIAGPETPQVIAPLLPLLPDASPEERQSILGILERVGAISPIEDVLLAARDFSVAERRETEAMISGLGPRAIGRVIHMLRNSAASCRSRIVAARALARLAPPQLALVADEAMTAELRRAREFTVAADSLAAGLNAPDDDGAVVLHRFYRDAAADAVDFVVHLLGLTGRLRDVDLLLASLAFGNAKDHANAVEAVEQSCPRGLFAQLQPLLGVTASNPAREPRLTPETVLRRASTSEQPVECAAALLALRARAPADAHFLVRQRIEATESPMITKMLAVLLPGFADLVSGDAPPALHPVQRIAALARASYFAGARIDGLEYLATRSSEEHAPDGSTLPRGGDAAPSLMVVASGRIDVSRGSTSVALGRGATCNEQVLLGKSGVAEHVVSRGATLLTIPVTTLSRAIEIFPALGISLYRTKIVPVA